MLSPIQAFDTAMTNGIYSFLPHNLFFDYIFSFLSLQGVAMVVWIILLILVLTIEEQRHRECIPIFGATIASAYFICNYVLKNIFARARPPAPDFYSVTSCPHDFSFPSSHASVAFAAAFALTSCDRKHGWIYYTTAVLISLSRIYLQCHYLLDVIAGAFVGLAIAHLVSLLFAHPASHHKKSVDKAPSNE